MANAEAVEQVEVQRTVKGPSPRRKEQQSVVASDPRLTTEEVIEIPALDIGVVTLTVVGDTELIVHAFGAKARKMMLASQMKEAKQKKAAKVPADDFVESLYSMRAQSDIVTKQDDLGRMIATCPYGFGIPAASFKAASVAAGRYTDLKMTVLRGAFHVMSGKNVKGDKLLPILKSDGTFADAVMREDVVRLPTGVADIRHRGMFELPWAVKLTIRFNRRAISIAQLANQLNSAGFGVGVGEWRPGSESGGEFGMFHVETGEEK